MYDFIILSLPRSGSHMLASALDSHPDIQCAGEYEMTEKFPLGRTEKRVKGCIIQGYHILRQIAPEWVNDVKIIRLMRPLDAIARSLHYGSPTGACYEQHLEPVERDFTRGYYPPTQSTKLRLNAEAAAIHAFLNARGHERLLTVTYHGLCGSKDAEAIRWEQAHRICDFLEVDRHPLIPKTRKPGPSPTAA